MGYTYYNPLKVWLDPASIADVVSYMQKYLSENPIKDTEEINQIIAEYIAAHPEIIGGVQSVNGETGEVVLTASDINTTGTTTIQAVLTSLSSQISEITQTVSQNTDDITDLKSALDDYFEGGNNLLPLRDFEYTYRGITLTIENGILHLTGTSTNAVRAKLSGETYEMVGTAKEDWKSETLSQFVIGNTYSLHNKIISGSLPSSVGVSLRDSTGSSVIGASQPQKVLDVSVSYAMLYIPSGTTLNVAFIPSFIQGTVDDPVYIKKLNPSVYVEGLNYNQNQPASDYIYNADYQSALKLPSNYKSTGKKTQLIVLCHGQTSTITSTTWGSANMRTLVNNFVGEGFGVLDVNQVTESDWCNPSLIKKYMRAINNVVSNYNVIPSIIYAESMGCLIGQTLSNLIKDVKVCAFGGLRLDFEARYNDADASEKAIIDSNIGFTNGYDPIIAAKTYKLAVSAVDSEGTEICPSQFPPSFFVYGTSDTYNTESLAKIQIITAGGNFCVSKEYTGNHSDVCYLLAGNSFDDVVAWFNEWI